MLKVGRDFVLKPKRRRMLYKDVPTQKGWADAFQYLPANYDLMLLKIQDRPGQTVGGWCFGTKWEGARINKADVITEWKRVKTVD